MCDKRQEVSNMLGEDRHRRTKEEELNPEKNFHQLYNDFRRMHGHRIKRELQKIGLTEGQPKVIGYLRKHDGCIQRELAENCHIKASTVTNLLVTMEKSDLISRSANLNDRRIMNVNLTEKGWTLSQEIESIFLKVDKQILEGFTSEEKLELNRMFKILCRNLEEEETIE